MKRSVNFTDNSEEVLTRKFIEKVRPLISPNNKDDYTTTLEVGGKEIEVRENVNKGEYTFRVIRRYGKYKTGAYFLKVNKDMNTIISSEMSVLRRIMKLI